MATLNVRNIDQAAHDRIRAAAQVRGWTVAKYVDELSRLHEELRSIADNNQLKIAVDSGDVDFSDTPPRLSSFCASVIELLLEERGLTTVSG